MRAVDVAFVLITLLLMSMSKIMTAGLLVGWFACKSAILAKLMRKTQRSEVYIYFK